VDITFWVIQAVLLTPVLFMAASAGMENPSGRTRGRPALRPAEPERLPRGQRAQRPVAMALAGLSQFTVEQQARLVILRTFVQEARLGRGALQDDMAPAPDSDENAGPSSSAAPASRRPRPRASTRQLLLAAGAVLVLLGAVGMVRTSMAMDDLQRTTTSRGVEPLTATTRFLPGVLVNPAKYLAAVNGSSAVSSVDPLYAVSLMEDKQAMDRWEALAGIGLALLLFMNAMRSTENDGEEGSVASDFAPFVLVAAVLFAALSFFELP
jgi:hypothetical protein